MASLKRIGIHKLPCDLLNYAHYGERFQIGGDEKIYLGDHRKPNGVYIENAVDRALDLYAQLPVRPNILRIDECPDLFISGLSAPSQRAENSCYWQLEGEPVFLRKLFREIVRAEIDAAGNEDLVSNVYFLNAQNDILFQLCDDREAIVLCKNK